MVTYVLDTDTLVYLLRGDGAIRRRLLRLEEAQLATTSLNLAELYFGAYSSERAHQNTQSVDRLRERLTVMVPGPRAAVLYGRTKAGLRREGIMIGELDLLIGATCLALGGVLVTNNARHFSRIEGLRTESWA